jgi:hypothetical protein
MYLMGLTSAALRRTDIGNDLREKILTKNSGKVEKKLTITARAEAGSNRTLQDLRERGAHSGSQSGRTISHRQIPPIQRRKVAFDAARTGEVRPGDKR